MDSAVCTENCNGCGSFVRFVRETNFVCHGNFVMMGDSLSVSAVCAGIVNLSWMERFRRDFFKIRLWSVQFCHSGDSAIRGKEGFVWFCAREEF